MRPIVTCPDCGYTHTADQIQVVNRFAAFPLFRVEGHEDLYESRYAAWHSLCPREAERRHYHRWQ